MWIGFLAVAFTDEPSPNDQDQEVGVLVEVSVKVTFSGAVPDTGVPVKLATGATVFTWVAANVMDLVEANQLVGGAVWRDRATISLAGAV